MRLYISETNDKIANLKKSLLFEGIIYKADILRYSYSGKPFLTGRVPLCLNISNTRNMWACLFRENYSVGLDMERDLHINED